MSLLARFTKAVELDAGVLQTILLRGWSVLAGAGTIAFIALYLSKEQQGYYYTFASLLALQIFFELGFSQVIVQFVAHELARAGSAGKDPVEKERHVDRLASIVQLMQRWYRVAALAYFAVLGTAGGLFLTARGSLPLTEWLPAWWILVGCTAVSLYASARLAALEGFGRVKDVALLRLRQSMAGYLLLWVLLYSGAGLWSAVAVPVVGAAATVVWLANNTQALKELNARRIEHHIDWKREVLPFQWRIAVSWISGYFIFQSFVPLTFASQGPVAAGRLGLSLSVFSAAANIGMSWVSARVPMLTTLIAEDKRAELNALFRRLFTFSTGFTALVSTAIVIAAYALTQCCSGVSDRFSDLSILVMLAVVSTANSAIFAAASYMRAHREEPMLAQSIVAGVLIFAAALTTVRSGVEMMIAAYLAITVLIVLPWTAFIFKRYHQLQPAASSRGTAP